MIQNELGGNNPIAINEYYRGGAYTPSNISQVPASGTIAFSNFYGVSKANTQSGAITGSKSGNIRLWKWTSSGSFIIFNPGYVDILVVGGGGRGYWGYGYAGGGGGGGGLIYIPSLYLQAGNYTVIIGGSGNDTSLYRNSAGYLTAKAGGGNPNTGGAGGSGSGDGGTATQSTAFGGGLSSVYGYGNRGGYYSYTDQGWNASGGGGGAGGVGGNGSGYYGQNCYYDWENDTEYCRTDYGSPYGVGGNGGDGRYYSIDINASYYAGGGGGASGFSDNVSYIWGYPFGYGRGYAIPYGGAGGGGRGTSRGEGNGSGYTGPANGTNGLGGGGGGGGPGNSNGYYTSGGSGVLIMSGSSSMLP